MTKKHFEAIAEAIALANKRDCQSPSEVAGVWFAAKAIAKVLKADNPRFDTHKFLMACEPKWD